MPKAGRKSKRLHVKAVDVDVEQVGRAEVVANVGVPAGSEVTLSDNQLESVVSKVAEKLFPLFSKPAQQEPFASGSGLQHKRTWQYHKQDRTKDLLIPSSNNDLLKIGQSPINVSVLKSYLGDYPNLQDARVLEEGFSNGFRLGFTGPRHFTDCSNLLSVKQNPDIAMDKVMKEVELGRIAGPFEKCPIGNLMLSPIGLVPKKDGNWRLIQHLSYPSGSSVNDFIDPESCSVKYTSIDVVIESIIKLGYDCCMGKLDIKSAFRLLPVHKEDFCLLGFRLEGYYFVDKMLPMGCAISFALWEKFACFLEWLCKHLYAGSQLHHYLDDFIFLGRKQSEVCSQTMSYFENICSLLGVPLAEGKTSRPTSVLVFLGLELNSISFQIKIPKDKLEKLRFSLLSFLKKKKVTLKEVQALVGFLNFCTRAIPVARAFNRRFYDAMSGLVKSFHHVGVTLPMKADIDLWLSFLEKFNGYCSFPELDWEDSNTLNLFTDSAGSPSLGCAAVFGNSWVFFPWPADWRGSDLFEDITMLELVPIVLGFCVWADSLQKKKIVLHVDNKSLVSILNKKSSKSKVVMHLLRPFILMCMQICCQFKAVHVSGVLNIKADSLSRCQWHRLREVFPEANAESEEIPVIFHQIISGLKSIC